MSIQRVTQQDYLAATHTSHWVGNDHDDHTKIYFNDCEVNTHNDPLFLWLEWKDNKSSTPHTIGYFRIDLANAVLDELIFHNGAYRVRIYHDVPSIHEVTDESFYVAKKRGSSTRVTLFP